MGNKSGHFKWLNISYWCWFTLVLQAPSKATELPGISCVCSFPNSCTSADLIKYSGQQWKCYYNKEFLNSAIIFLLFPICSNIQLNNNRDIDCKEEYSYLTVQLQCYVRKWKKSNPLFLGTCKWAVTQRLTPEAIIPSVWQMKNLVHYSSPADKGPSHGNNIKNQHKLYFYCQVLLCRQYSILIHIRLRPLCCCLIILFWKQSILTACHHYCTWKGFIWGKIVSLCYSAQLSQKA